jgi:drug/metabolite transporter superfamily protein YnfA
MLSAGDIPASLALKLPFIAAVLAELIGLPFAWLRLRKSEAWAKRPPGVRRLDLLTAFTAKITGLLAGLGALIAISALVASGL